MKNVVVAGCAAVLLCACGSQVHTPVSDTRSPDAEMATKSPNMARSTIAPADDRQGAKRDDVSMRTARDFKDAAPELDTSK